MYLSKKTYVKNWSHTKPENKIKITIKSKSNKIEGIKPKRIETVVEEIGSWRKANAIHHWIVENVQEGEDDCKEYLFERENMEELLKICKVVDKNHLLAPKLLPTQTGFFFGSEEYDEYYFQDITDTIKILEEALKEEGNGDFYYQSSW